MTSHLTVEQRQLALRLKARGLSLRHSNFSRRVWVKARGLVGLSGVHFHDLRHYRKLAHGGRWREPARADGTHGSQQHSGGLGVPALDGRAATRACGCCRQGGALGSAPGEKGGRRQGIWHESGTEPEASLVKINSPGRGNALSPGPGLADDCVRLAGLEPATRCLEGSRSVHLSYRRP